MFNRILLAVAITATAFSSTGAAQDASVGLQGIVSGKSTAYGHLVKSVDKLWADSRGGELICTAQHAFAGNTEQVKITWQFDGDITSVPQGGSITVTLKISFLKTSKPPNPNKQPDWHAIGSGGIAGANSNVVKEQFPDVLDKWNGLIFGAKNEEKTVFGRSTGNPIHRVATSTYKLQVGDGIRNDFFGSMFFSLGGYHDVIYVFRANVAPKQQVQLGEPPKRTETTTGGPDSGTSVRDGGLKDASPKDVGSKNGGSTGSKDGNNREVIIEQGTRHGTPPSRNGAGAGDFGDPPWLRPSSERPTGMTIVAGQRTVKPNELVQVPIYLAGATNVANINITVTYGTQVVRAEDDPLGGNILPAGTLFAGNSKESGTVRLGFAGRSGANGNGTIAEIRFRATGQPGDSTPLTVAVTKIDDPSGRQLPVAVVHGQVIIVDSSGRIPGDIDGDGRVTPLDAMLALKMSVKRIPEQGNYDLDSDSTVTSRDAVLILQRAIQSGP